MVDGMTVPRMLTFRLRVILVRVVLDLWCWRMGDYRYEHRRNHKIVEIEGMLRGIRPYRYLY